MTTTRTRINAVIERLFGPPVSYCCDDRCSRRAVREVPVGMVGDTPLTEHLCRRHARGASS